jgi:type IV secretory pathway VirB10-like protein
MPSNTSVFPAHSVTVAAGRNTSPISIIDDSDTETYTTSSQSPSKLSGELAALSARPKPPPQPKITTPLPCRWTMPAKNCRQITLAGWATKETPDQRWEQQHRESVAAQERHEATRREHKALAAAKHEKELAQGRVRAQNFFTHASVWIQTRLSGTGLS